MLQAELSLSLMFCIARSDLSEKSLLKTKMRKISWVSQEHLEEDDEQRAYLYQREEVALDAAGVDQRFVFVPDEQAVDVVPDVDPDAVGQQAEGGEQVEEELELGQSRVHRPSFGSTR